MKIDVTGQKLFTAVNTLELLRQNSFFVQDGPPLEWTWNKMFSFKVQRMKIDFRSQIACVNSFLFPLRLSITDHSNRTSESKQNESQILQISNSSKVYKQI